MGLSKKSKLAGENFRFHVNERLESRWMLSSIYVDAGATGAANGQSWANAFPSLQSALTTAQSGDVVLVAGGTYKPSLTDSTATFHLKTGVEIDGGYAGISHASNPDVRNLAATPSTLSGALSSGVNSFHVVTGSGTSSSAILDGFTLSGGYAATSQPGFDASGAGLYDSAGSPTVRNCTFANNYAGSDGGAIANLGASHPSIVNCIFTGNQAGYMGGAISDEAGSSAQLTGCTFTDNTAEAGGAVAEFFATGTIANCTFTRNSATSFGIGGGLDVYTSTTKITNSVFEGNKAIQGGGAYVGSGGSPTFLDCVFAGNTATQGGGGIGSNASTERIFNCTITANVGTGVYNVSIGAPPSIVNSIVSGNGGGDVYSGTDNTPTAFSDTSYTLGGSNMNVDPDFVMNPSAGNDSLWGTADDNYGNLQLASGSPLIDAGTNTVSGVDFTSMNDVGGNPRLVNATGQSAAVVDIGAYEAPSTSPPPTTSVTGKVFFDFNGDHIMDSMGGGLQPDRGVVGATVYIDNNGDRVLDDGEVSAVTDANGLYTFNGLTAGSYSLRQVQPQGTTVAPFPDGSLFIILRITSSTTTGVDFADAPIPNIAGTVFADTDGNGVRGPNEPATSGVTMVLHNAVNGAIAAFDLDALTDANGYYHFDSILGGDYTLSERLPTGYARISSPATGVYSLPYNGNDFLQTGEDFGNVPTPSTAGASISGVVYNDSNGNGVQNTDESGLADINVYNDANNNGKFDPGEAVVITGSTGEYEFLGLPAGSYKIRQYLPSGSKQTTPANGFGWTLTLTAEQSVVGQNFGEQTGVTPPPPLSGGSISGTVFNDLNGNGTLNSGEIGISGITVYNDANNNGKMDSGEATTMTDASGNYTLSNLPAGNYKIREIVPAGSKQTTPANGFGWTLMLAKNQTLAGKNFGEQSAVAPPPSTGASISGSVFNDLNANLKQETGELGLSAWTVFIDGNNDGILDNNELATLTKADGSYAFVNLSAGNYLLRAIRPAGWSQTTPTNGFGQHLTIASNQNKTGVLFGERSIA